MLKPISVAIALALAAFTAPAFAGSWPNVPTSRGTLLQSVPHPAQEATSGTFETRQAKPFAPAPRTAARAPDGFTFVGGDTGWEPANHKYVVTAQGLAHSNECDHMIRIVQGPTPAEVEATRSLSPGV
jgi:hypothetical protein